MTVFFTSDTHFGHEIASFINKNKRGKNVQETYTFKNVFIL